VDLCGLEELIHTISMKLKRQLNVRNTDADRN